MKTILMVLVLCGTFAFAEESKPVVAAKVEAVKIGAEKITNPVIEPMPEAAPVMLEGQVVEAPKNLPPAWLDKVLNVASGLPVVGPVIVEIAKWLGVIASMMTILVTALLGLFAVLSRVSSLAKFAGLAAKVELFANGPVMYWLKFFSMYNAKKQDEQKKS